MNVLTPFQSGLLGGIVAIGWLAFSFAFFVWLDLRRMKREQEKRKGGTP